MLKPFENGFYQPGQHGFGSHFYKSTDAEIKQIFDFIYKIHRTEYLIPKQLFHALRIIRIFFRADIGQHRHMRWQNLNLFKGFCENFPCVFHQKAVKCRRYRQPFCAKAAFLASCLRLSNGFKRTGQHALIRTVAVGKHQIKLFLFNHLLNFFKRGFDCQHGSGIFPAGFCHQLSPKLGEFKKRIFIQSACRIQGAQFAIAMPQNHFRIQSEPFQYFEHCRTDRADSWLGNIGGAKPFFLYCFFFSSFGRNRIDKICQTLRQINFFIGIFQKLKCLREKTSYVLAHVDILASLPRKNKRHFSRFFGTVKDIADSPRCFVFLCFKRGQCVCENFALIIMLLKNQKHPMRCVSRKYLTALICLSRKFLFGNAVCFTMKCLNCVCQIFLS